MWSLLGAGLGSLLLSGHARAAAILPRQDDLAALVSSAAAEAGIGPATPNPSQKIDLVLAIGDSYTAGVGSNGLPDYIESSGSCSRYRHSWPSQLSGLGGWNDFNGGSTPLVSFGACTGAKTQEVIDHQLSQGDPFEQQSQYNNIGKPQVALMTIGGNDIGFGGAINDCIYRIWRPNDCDETLAKMESYVGSNDFNADIVRVFLNVLASGRQAGGAVPTDSFQLYVAEYVGFWNHDDTGCDTVTWCAWYSQKIYLTTKIRRRMNNLVDSLNNKLRSIADEMTGLGVFWVDGVNQAYNGHRFCEPAPEDYLKNPGGSVTWFWSWASGDWNGGSEGPDGTPSAQDFYDIPTKLIEKLFPDPVIRATISDTNPPWNLSPAFNSEEELYSALAATGDVEAQVELPDSTRRMFHPKGTAYGPYANAFLNAIRSHRSPVTQQTSEPPPPPPPAFASGQCAFHLREEWQAYPEREDGETIITVKLYDNAQTEIGHLDRTVITAGVGVDVTSALPYTVSIMPGDTGEDWQFWNYLDFGFAYGATSWPMGVSEGAARCTVGGRDSMPDLGLWMSQDMDCFFPC